MPVPFVATYIGYGSPQVKIYFPVEHIAIQIVDEENGNVTVVPAKNDLAAFFGTEPNNPRNIATPTQKYKVVLAIRGELHDLLASEYGGASDLDGYAVKNNVVDFWATKRAKATSKPTVFNYPHWHAVGTHQEFEGVMTKFMIDDDAGIGSGLDFPAWPFTMEWTVAKTNLPF